MARRLLTSIGRRRARTSIAAAALGAAAALVPAALAAAAAPTGFTPPQTVGAGLDGFEVAAAGAARGAPAGHSGTTLVVAWAARGGGVAVSVAR